MKNYKVVAVVFLIGITVFSVFKYVTVLREKNNLVCVLDGIKKQVADLENEKQNLLQIIKKGDEAQDRLNKENAELRESLNNIDASFFNLRNNIKKLNLELEALKAENTAVKAENESLARKAGSALPREDVLEVQLNSVTELKKAITKLKKQIRSLNKKVKAKARKDVIVEGNRGFLIKAGQSTYPARIKIEVNPVSPNISQ